MEESLAEAEVGAKFRLFNKANDFYYIGTVVSVDVASLSLVVKYSKDDCMSKEVWEAIPDEPVEVQWSSMANDLIWIDDGDVICPVCGDDTFEDLFMCSNQTNDHEVGYHSKCIAPDSGYIVPSFDNTDTWLCPMHQRLFMCIFCAI